MRYAKLHVLRGRNTLMSGQLEMTKAVNEADVFDMEYAINAYTRHGLRCHATIDDDPTTPKERQGEEGDYVLLTKLERQTIRVVLEAATPAFLRSRGVSETAKNEINSILDKLS